jgi:hypothetical protein
MDPEGVPVQTVILPSNVCFTSLDEDCFETSLYFLDISGLNIDFEYDPNQGEGEYRPTLNSGDFDRNFATGMGIHGGQSGCDSLNTEWIGNSNY